VRLTGTGVFNTHIATISSGLTQITTDRPLPDGLTSVRFARLNAYAVSDTTITSGTTAGNILKVGSKVASKFMGPVGLALTAKAAYDQGPVTDSQREGDRQAQSGAANRFAAQKNRNISSEIPKVSAPEPKHLLKSKYQTVLK
jgi:hypothetical protein